MGQVPLFCCYWVGALAKIGVSVVTRANTQPGFPVSVALIGDRNVSPTRQVTRRLVRTEPLSANFR